jgi:hypothetical protein
MKKITFLLLAIATCSFSQSKDEAMLKSIYKSALTESHCYSWLDDLSNKVGQRLSGSKGAENAVIYTKIQMETLGLDKVYLQEVMVPKWVRGEKEAAYVQLGKQKISFPICALGMSVATPKNGVSASIIEVKSLDELKELGSVKLFSLIDQ